MKSLKSIPSYKLLRTLGIALAVITGFIAVSGFPEGPLWGIYDVNKYWIAGLLLLSLTCIVCSLTLTHWPRLRRL